MQETESELSVSKHVKAFFEKKINTQGTRAAFLIFLFIAACLAIILGILFMLMRQNKIITVNNYGGNMGCQNISNGTCHIGFQIDQELQTPIQIMYSLSNFVANSRQYLNSRSHRQLRGKEISKKQALVCQPYITNREMNKTVSWTGQPLDPDAIASPCGFQAKSFFQDTFTIKNPKGQQIPIKSRIYLQKLKRTPNSQRTQWIDPTLDAFQIWMTTSVSPRVRKWYGQIEQNLQKGNYTVEIQIASIYHPSVQKNLQLVKQYNQFGSTRLVAIICLSAGILLLGFVVIFTFINLRNKITQEN